MATKTATTGRESDKFMLRLPDGMRALIKEAAEKNGRTMNAEVVVRLGESLSTERPDKDHITANTTEQLLKQLPADLVSQYGLHLYRAELDRVESQAEEARQQHQPLYDRLQELLSTDAPPGTLTKAKQAVSAKQKRIHELDEQANLLRQTIDDIHTYRKVHGLPEIRNVRGVAASIRTR